MVGVCHLSALVALLVVCTVGVRGDAREAADLPGSVACLRRPGSSHGSLCEAGLCAGADGRCHREANEAVAGGFTLVNARWPRQRLHLGPDKLGTSASPPEGAETEFDLFALPRKAGEEQAYVLASRGGKTAAACTSIGGGGSCIAKAADVSTAEAFELGVRLAAAPWYEGAPPGAQTLTIEAAGSPGAFFAADGASPFHAAAEALVPGRGPDEVHPLPVLAMGGPTGIGVGAFWIADPPLPLQLPPYAGPRCILNCGAFGSGGVGQGSRRLWLVRFLALCGVLLTLTLGCLGVSVFRLLAECNAKGRASRRR